VTTTLATGQSLVATDLEDRCGDVSRRGRPHHTGIGAARPGTTRPRP